MSDELADFLAETSFVCPNLNDCFDYACADSQQITSGGDGGVMAAFWRQHGHDGFLAIAAWARKRHPLPELQSPQYFAALAEIAAQRPVDEDDDEWTLIDEFEIEAGGHPAPRPGGPR